MNILILSVTAGEGHNSTAKAMQAYFRGHGADCVMLDTFGYISPTMAKLFNDGYLFVLEKAKNAYKIGYGIAEKFDGKKPEGVLVELANAPFLREIGDYVQNDKPDAVVFTHPFAGVICGLLKRDGRIRVPTVGILTDFVFHPFWENCRENDFVILPTKQLKYQAYRKGFTDKQIRSFGIPIHPKFSVAIPKEEAQRKVGLKPGVATVLLMGGSMGYGNLDDTVAELDAMELGRDFQIAVVCGNNAEAKEKIEARTFTHNVLALGFVDYVDVLMDASDCIVTKPGGLTTSEALAKGLPMVIVNPIPGQETRNTEFLLNSGAAVFTNDFADPAELVCDLMSSPDRLAAMRTCIAEIAHPNSTVDTCEFIMHIASVPKYAAPQV